MTQQDAECLAQAFRNRFGAEVGMELVNPVGRYRFEVVSPQFQKMTQLARQDEIWKVVNETMSRDATLDITLILAFAPDELVDTGV
jgi:stress-induced morphogen